MRQLRFPPRAAMDDPALGAKLPSAPPVSGRKYPRSAPAVPRSKTVHLPKAAAAVDRCSANCERPCAVRRAKMEIRCYARRGSTGTEPSKPLLVLTFAYPRLTERSASAPRCGASMPLRCQAGLSPAASGMRALARLRWSWTQCREARTSMLPPAHLHRVP